MDFISLSETLDSIAGNVPVSDELVAHFDEAEARKYSHASGKLHQALFNSQSCPKWVEHHKTTSMPVFNDAVANEGMAMLEHMSGWWTRYCQEKGRHVDSCIVAGLDHKTEPQLIDINSGQYKGANFIRAREIGFDRAELVTLLDKNEIAHTLTIVPIAKEPTNQKKWGNAELLALLDEYQLPGATQETLAKQHNVKRARIGFLLGEARKLKSRTPSVFDMSFVTHKKTTGGQRY